MTNRDAGRDTGVRRSCRQAIGTALLAGLFVTVAGAAPSRFERTVSPPWLHGPSFSTASSRAATGPAAARNYGKLPLTFEANLGQADGRARFVSRGSGYTLFLTGDEAVLSLQRGGRRDVLRLGLTGANRSPRVAGQDVQPGTSNYFVGNDPAKWRTNVPHYGKVRYEAVYPGIDLVYYGNEQRLEHDFVVAAGADPSVIRLTFAGAKDVRTDDAGNLVLTTNGGEVALQAPVVYQEVNGARRPVSGQYRLTAKNEASFEVGSYDRRLALVIDPVLVYSTYLGGSGDDTCPVVDNAAFGCGGIAVDASGSAYVTGQTGSLDFPTQNPLYSDPGDANLDVYVTKLAPSGSALVYSTYLGGAAADHGYAIALGPGGTVYVTGQTQSANFPTTPGAYDTELAGVSDVFVTKLDAAGSALVYSTFLGGSIDDAGVPSEYWGELGRSIAVDAAGAAYVTGMTASTDFPTAPGAGLLGNQAERDAFITKVNASGTGLDYSTYFGGAGLDVGVGIAIDGSGNAYVTGFAESTNLPTVRAYSTTNTGKRDAYVAEVNTDGTAWLFSTYIGGSDDDGGYGIALDSAGAVYIVGSTASTPFFGNTGYPTVNPFQTYGEVWNALVTKIDPTTTPVSLAYSTYLGGSSYDYGLGIAVDSTGAAYVTGRTFSTDFPTSNYFQLDPGDANSDVFVTKLTPAGNALGYSSYLGGAGDDAGFGIALDPVNNAYITGRTESSTSFPTLNAYQGTFGGGTRDAFVTRVGDSVDLVVTNEDSPDPVFVGGTLTYTVTVTNSGLGAATNVRMTETLGAILTYVSAIGGSGCSVAGQVVTCTAATLASGGSVVFTITAIPGDGESTVTSSASATADQPDTNPDNNTDRLAVTLVQPAADVSVTMTESGDPWPAGPLSYVVRVRNWGPSTAASVVLTDTLGANVTLSSVPSGCSAADGKVTCTFATLAAGAIQDVVIPLTATRGTTTNTASVTSGTTDLVAGNNNSTESTLVYETAAGNEVPFLTATARSDRIVVEWLNPPAPYESTIVRYTPPATEGCTAPTLPSQGQPLAVQAGTAATHDSYEHTAVLPAVDYCYSVFVHKGDGLISLAKSIVARPVAADGAVKWAYSTGIAALAPVAVGTAANAVSNDGVVHALARGSSGGTWPSGWAPYQMAGPPQHRPTSLPITTYGVTSRQMILNAQDGRTYSVDPATGALLWQTEDFGTLQAGTAGWLQAYGAPADYLLVGTRNEGANNRLLAIDPLTRLAAWSYSDVMDPIGPISAQATVDYDRRVVYFTSEEYSSGAQTVWCVNLDSPHDKVWSRALGSSTSSPIYRGSVLYVGTTAGGGTIYALNVVNGDTLGSLPTGDGEPNDLIMPDRWSDDLYFSTATKVWSVSDSGAGGLSANWSTESIASPTAPLYTTDDKLLYVGSPDGRLWQIDTRLMPNEATALKSVLLGKSGVAVGAPTRDNPNDLIYVGSESGAIYAVQQPLP